MKRSFKLGVAGSLFSLIAFSLATPVVAQHGGGSAGAGARPTMPAPGGMTMPAPGGTTMQDRLRTPDQTRDQDRLRTPDQTRDQDRLLTPDQTRDKDQDKTQDRLRDPDQLQDRDRLQVSQAVDGQLASWELLTDSERQQFRSQMRTASTQQERDRIRSEHQAKIRQRAGDLGIDAPFGPGRATSGNQSGYYLAQMLPEQERLQFYKRMQQASNDQERLRIRNEMQTMARERAAEMGIEIPSWYGARSGQE